MNHIFHNCEDTDAELDRLRAELEAIKSADDNKDWLALVAKNKSLRAELEQAKSECYRLGHRNISLRAEVAELREALAGVLEECNGRNLQWFADYNDKARHSARAILARTQKTTDEPPATDPGSQKPE